MNADMVKKLKHGFFTASAVGVLMAAQGAVAAGDDYKEQAQADETHQTEQHTQSQDTQAQSTQAQSTQAQDSQQSQSQGPQFSEVDTDNDGEAKWNDIEPQFQEQLSKANWNEQNVLDQFDTDKDQALNADEYENFKSILMAHAGTQGAQQQAQMEQGQQTQQAQQEQQEYEQQAELEQSQQEQQAPQEQQEFEEQAQLESDQTQEQQGGIDQAQQDPAQQDQAQQDQEYTEQAELEQQEEQQLDTEQQRDQEIQTEQDQQFDSGQQQDQQFDQETQQAQQDQQLETEQQAAQQQGSPAQAQPADSTLLSMPVDQVAQAAVVNSRGEEIGQVSRVVRNNSTGELGLVVRSGGILGLGGSSVLVTLGEVSQMDEGRLLWDTMLSQDEIAEMPEFDETQYSEIEGTEYATLEEAQGRG